MQPKPVVSPKNFSQLNPTKRKQYNNKTNNIILFDIKLLRTEGKKKRLLVKPVFKPLKTEQIS